MAPELSTAAKCPGYRSRGEKGGIFNRKTGKPYPPRGRTRLLRRGAVPEVGAGARSRPPDQRTLRDQHTHKRGAARPARAHRSLGTASVSWVVGIASQLSNRPARSPHQRHRTLLKRTVSLVANGEQSTHDVWAAAGCGEAYTARTSQRIRGDMTDNFGFMLTVYWQ